MKIFRSISFLALALFALWFGSTAAARAPQRSADNSLVRFSSQGQVLGFRADEFFVSNATYALHVRFVGANAITPQSNTPTQTNSNAAPPLSRVTYANLWDGITLTYDAAHGGVVTSNYLVAPKADPQAIRLQYNAPVTLNADGTLTLAYASGNMMESAPIAWQEADGTRHAIPVAFRLQPSSASVESVAFEVGAYDTSQPLFIDPTLIWNTFLGGSEFDTGSAIAVDGSGNVYVGGKSDETWGAPVHAFRGDYDAFVAKLDPSGSLLWNTFLGGSEYDEGSAIAVDGSGNVYVGGKSDETWGAPVRAYSGSGFDAFAAKLDASGNLTWNTFLGGSQYDEGNAIAVDASENVYVGGTSYGTWGLPVRAFTGGIFTAKLDASGNLIWNTFLGGGDIDQSNAIAVDDRGSVYVGGTSDRTWGLPVRAFTDGSDAFAAKLDTSGNLTWNTFLGGRMNDQGTAVAVDGSGNVYVAGLGSAGWGSPVRAYTGDFDAFAAKLNASGYLTWNTFLGGRVSDWANAIAVDGSGNVYVAGRSFGTWGAPVRAFTGDYDAFAAKMDFTGVLTWNTFLGSRGTDGGNAVAVDEGGNVYVGGTSHGGWGSPVRGFSGIDNAFAAKIDNSPTAPIPVFPQNGVNLRLLKFTLEWKCLPCGDFFNLKIKDVTLGKLLVKQQGIKAMQFDVSGVKRGHSYWWQVQSCNSTGCTKGPKFKFTISKSAKAEGQP